MQQRDINKILAIIFLQRLVAYLLVLKYLNGQGCRTHVFYGGNQCRQKTITLPAMDCQDARKNMLRLENIFGQPDGSIK